MQIKNATILAAGSFASLLAGGVSAQAETNDGLTGQTVDKNGLKRFAFNAVGVDKQPRTFYVDENGVPVASNALGKIPKEIPGYELIKTNEGPDEIHYVYRIKPQAKTTVYVEKDGKVIIPESYGTLEKRELPGYKFIETKTEGDKTTHVYERQPVVVKSTVHVDEEGNSLIPEEFGFTGKSSIPGYVHLKTTETETERKHVYKKIPVEIRTTVYVDKAGKVLIPESLGTLEKRDIPTYTYVETKVEGNKTIHVYEPTVKKTTVNLRVVDEDTGVELIKPFEIGKGEIGSEYNLTDEVVNKTLANLPAKDRVAVYNKTTGAKVHSAIVNTSNSAFEMKQVNRVDDKGKMDFIDNLPVEERNQSSLIRDNYVLSNAHGAYNLNAVPEEKDSIAWYGNDSYWQFYQGDAENLLRLLKYKYQEGNPNASDINSLVYLDENRQTLSAFDLHYVDFSQSDSVGKRLDKSNMTLAEDGNSNLFTIYVKANKLKDRSEYIANDHI